MAFHFEERTPSNVGKKMMSTMAGVDLELANLSIKDQILSKYNNSMENLKEKARSGQDWQAQADLAMIYRYGIPELNIEKDFDTAIGWYESSIQNGNFFAVDILNLATLYDSKGTVLHQRRAFESYSQAVNLGSVQAALNLAEMYRCGVEGVVNEDLEEAILWYRRAAGEEPFNDDNKDSTFPSVACLKGTMRNFDVDSKLNALKKLHEYYMCGDCPEGKPQPIKALYYLKKAAELGDLEAQKDLGLSYLTGESGHHKDLDKAKRWLGKAANGGDQEAKETLKKLEKEKIVEVVQPEAGQTENERASFQQYIDIFKLNMQQNQQHPYAIQNPMMFQESLFTQFPKSPTAQNYLKAFRLVKKGLDKLQSSSFKDPEGITLIAQGVMYENSITQSFPETRDARFFLPSLFTLICERIKMNSNFFEGLLLIILLYPLERKVSLESYKLDVKKTMALNNLIHLIKKAEPDKPPKDDPYNFEEDYCSWLHVLYYFLGSLYIITDCFKDGADAFQKSLNFCPSYYEAKMGFAYCLMNMGTKTSNENALNPDEKLLETFEPPIDQRIPKGDYLTWTPEQLRKKAKQLFMEYLQEAPECDKKYPNCYYHLAVLYILEGDLQEAVKWKERGEDAEEKRLPFMPPVDVNSKKMLAMLDMLPIPKKEKKCSNRKCPNKSRNKLALKPCPCHEASYCGSECQAEDWKEHKKTCSWKKKKGKKS